MFRGRLFRRKRPLFSPSLPGQWSSAKTLDGLSDVDNFLFAVDNTPVSIKIKGCTSCWSSYTWQTWQTLKLLRIETPDNAETRQCSKCDGEMTVDVEHINTLDIRTTLEKLQDNEAEYQQTRRQKLMDRVRAGVAVFGVSVIVVVAVAMWWN